MQLTDGTAEVVEHVDGYAPEGALTTFFAVEPGRTVRLDPWAVRVLSIRTDRIARIGLIQPAVTCSPTNSAMPTSTLMSLVAG